jgi:TPR repeat protein
MKSYIKNNEILLSLYLKNKYLDTEKASIYKIYLKKLRKLAYIGNSLAQYDLAQHYEDNGYLGYPNPKFNNNKRFYWYIKAAENDSGEAYNNLADLFERGDGCEKDLEKALLYYKKSMDLGYNVAKKNYTKMLKDLKKGGIYYE